LDVDRDCVAVVEWKVATIEDINFLPRARGPR
jgi:hypothetical protein